MQPRQTAATIDDCPLELIAMLLGSDSSIETLTRSRAVSVLFRNMIDIHFTYKSEMLLTMLGKAQQTKKLPVFKAYIDNIVKLRLDVGANISTGLQILSSKADENQYNYLIDKAFLSQQSLATNLLYVFHHVFSEKKESLFTIQDNCLIQKILAYITSNYLLECVGLLPSNLTNMLIQYARRYAPHGENINADINDLRHILLLDNTSLISPRQCIPTIERVRQLNPSNRYLLRALESLELTVRVNDKFITNGSKSTAIQHLKGTYVNIRGATLTEIDLRGQDLRHLDAVSATFNTLLLDNTNMSGIDLSHSRVISCSFKRSNLKYINLTDASIYLTDFSGADLSYAWISTWNANVIDPTIIFTNTKLTNVRWFNNDMIPVNIFGMGLAYSHKWPNSNLHSLLHSIANDILRIVNNQVAEHNYEDALNSLTSAIKSELFNPNIFVKTKFSLLGIFNGRSPTFSIYQQVFIKKKIEITKLMTTDITKQIHHNLTGARP